MTNTNNSTAPVRLRARGSDVVVTVSAETAEMLLRNKGEYKRAKDPAPAPPPAPTTPAADTVPVKPEWPKGSAEEWAAYATHLGLDIDGLDRAEIAAKVAEHEAAGAES